MPLNIIGLGLFDEKDITVRGLEMVKASDAIYLEGYTAILLCQKERLETFYEKEVILADRDFVEQKVEAMLERAKTENISFLVVGDPFCATTHSDLYLRAWELGIKINIVHNASCMSAVAATGLQLYSFGHTISICFFEDNWKPESFYDRIVANQKNNLHTLCLLDIKVKERSLENLMRNRDIFEPPRYMSAALAARQCLEIEAKRNEGVCKPDSYAFAVCRLGSDTQYIRAAKLSEIAEMDDELGPPLHCLVICAPHMHEMEMEFMKVFDGSNRPIFPAIEKLEEKLEDEENNDDQE